MKIRGVGNGSGLRGGGGGGGVPMIMTNFFMKMTNFLVVLEFFLHQNYRANMIDRKSVTSCNWICQ